MGKSSIILTSAVIFIGCLVLHVVNSAGLPNDVRAFPFQHHGGSTRSPNTRNDRSACNVDNIDGRACEHCCINTTVTSGYVCRCRDGFVPGDGNEAHLCFRENCGKPNSFHSFGEVVAIDSWRLHSSAVYRCKKPYTLTGDFYQTCMGRPTATGWNEFSTLTGCTDQCHLSDLSKQPLCGKNHLDGAACRQNGCCYDTNTMTCRYKPVKVYVRYMEEKTLSGVTKTLHRHNDQSCQHECNQDSSCKAISLEHSLQSSGFVDQTCYIHGNSRGTMMDGGHVTVDANFDIYNVLQVDNTTNIDSAEDILKKRAAKLYEGCYRDSPGSHDLPFLVARETSMTITRCIDTCRMQSFHFAALQNGSDCYCGNSMLRRHGESDACNKGCSGDDSQTCGGYQDNAIYKLDIDHRYLGCYRDVAGNRDLPTHVTTSGKISAQECVQECAQRHLKFAGSQDGGDCFCGKRYGKYGGAEEFECGLTCGKHGAQNCGGDMVNAIYLTDSVYDPGRVVDPAATRIHSSDGNIIGLDPQIFTVLKGMKTFVSKTLVLHSDQPIKGLGEEPLCNTDCYQPCGNIENEAGYSNVGDDVILRWFYFRLSDLPKYIGNNPKRVYVYAQTLIIDGDIDVEYALQLRARQILIDSYETFVIQVYPNAQDLGNDNDVIKYRGPFPDLTHQKQSYMCARILLDTKEQVNINLAFAIVNEISTSPKGGEEQTSFSGMVRAYASSLSGITRANVHFVPSYTKAAISSKLDVYYNQIHVYKYVTDKLLSQVVDNAEFVDLAEQAALLYKQTDVAQTREDYDKALADIEGAQNVYHQVETHYNVSVTEMQLAEVAFEKGIERYEEQQVKGPLFGFLVGMGKCMVGAVTQNYGMVVGGVVDMFGGIRDLANVMKEIAQIVKKIQDISDHAFSMMEDLTDMDKHYDPSTHMEDIEQLTSLKSSVVEWQNLQNHAYVILNDEMIKPVYYSERYGDSVMSTGHIGEVLTESMIERAELSRDAIEKRALLDAKLRQQERVHQLIEDMKDGIGRKEAVLAGIHEQTLDVRMDLNDALLQFCQAYFYETHTECSSTTKPAFGGSLGDLLTKIDSARNDEMLVEDEIIPEVEVAMKIVDTNVDPNCTDAKVCPVNFFRHHRYLHHNLHVSHPAFDAYERCRITELVVKVPGASSSDPDNNNLMVRIEASGSFQGRHDGDVYAFITRPISLGMRYDIITDFISIHADIYSPVQGIYNHMTPFTTWIITMHETYGHIQLDEVKEISMSIIGRCLTV